MAVAFERVAVVGATGPMGRALVREFARRGHAVRAVSRSMAHLAAAFPYDPIERRVADARDVRQLSAALAGADLVVDAIGLPVRETDQHVVSARTLAAVLRASGAHALMVSSTWSYMPITTLPLAETHARSGGPPLAAMRREAEDALAAAGAGIVHLPDFFGPHVHDGTLQLALSDAVAGRAMRWLGGRHVRRDYIFVPDAAALTVDLALCEDARGEHWIVPGSGAVSGAEIAAMASARLARDVRLRPAGLAALRMLALFDRRLAGFLQIAPEYVKPVSYDASRLERLLGPRPRTAYDQAIAKTLEWLMDAEA